jgi:hypothetical protein
VEKYGRARQATDDNIIRRMRFTCWIGKTTNTHSEYVILIAFPLQLWLRERASVLYYKYLVCRVTHVLLKPKGQADVSHVTVFPDKTRCTLRR